jgi:hypothetical protein
MFNYSSLKIHTKKIKIYLSSLKTNKTKNANDKTKIKFLNMQINKIKTLTIIKYNNISSYKIR